LLSCKDKIPARDEVEILFFFLKKKNICYAVFQNVNSRIHGEVILLFLERQKIIDE